jgi:hypothetical protein
MEAGGQAGTAYRPKGRSKNRSGPKMLEHDPEKWVPVFRKDHAQTKA